MKNLSKSIKTLGVSALFAASSMVSTTASAIEGGPGGTVIMYKHTWSAVQNLCSHVNCISIVPQGSGWRVTWK